jgi:hypothetical protein|nr:MAG TPA: hypothetical protein [Caudoviricetes sp.]
MAIAGRVAIVPKGDWSADATYKRLDAVTYNNTLYFAKKEVPAGTATSNTEYWSKSIVGGAGAIATKEDAGIVKPTDGLSIAEDGTLKVNIDGATLTMDQVNNVIKLSDTLKDKINGAFPAANLINNLTTTEAGFGLDARQGKALDDKITEINGSLKGVINTKNFEVTDKTILEYILSTHSFIGSQTFTATCADKPPNNAEYNIFWFGSNMRITVLALEYAFNTSKLYRREIFGNEWLTGWIEL